MLEGKQYSPFHQTFLRNVHRRYRTHPLIIFLFLLIERYTEIERENRILLEKMTNIL